MTLKISIVYYSCTQHGTQDCKNECDIPKETPSLMQRCTSERNQNQERKNTQNTQKNTQKETLLKIIIIISSANIAIQKTKLYLCECVVFGLQYFAHTTPSLLYPPDTRG